MPASIGGTALDHAADYLNVVGSDEARAQGYPQRVRIVKRGRMWTVLAA